jgi:hypothetical protein
MGKSKMVKCPLSKLSREHEAVDVRKGGSKSQKQKKKRKKKKEKERKSGANYQGDSLRFRW